MEKGLNVNEGNLDSKMNVNKSLEFNEGGASPRVKPQSSKSIGKVRLKFNEAYSSPRVGMLSSRSTTTKTISNSKVQILDRESKKELRKLEYLKVITMTLSE